MNDSVNAAFGKVEMLVGHNYHIWAMKIASILRSRKLYREIIEGEEPLMTGDGSSNAEELKKHSEWESKNDEAFGIIVLSLVTDQAAMFINETKAKVVWESLKNMYAGNTEERIIDAMLEWKDLKMGRNEGVDQYVTRTKSMIARVTALGGKISSREAVYYLVRGLNHRMESVGVVLRARKDHNIDEVHQILKEEEVRLDKNMNMDNWNKVSEESAFRTKQRKGFMQNKYKSKECYICGKNGHIARDCWSRKKTNRFNNFQDRKSEKLREETAQVTCNREYKHSAFHCGQQLGNKTSKENKDTAYSKWSLDSGCSVHMTSEKSYLKQLEEYNSVINMAESGRNIKAVAKGTMNMKTQVGSKEINLKMNNVLYVPKLRDNLLSVGELVRRGNRVEFNESGAIIYGAAGNVIAKGQEENSMYVIEGWVQKQIGVESEHKEEEQKCAQSQQEGKMLWHRRLGHLNPGYMDKMLTENTVRNLEYNRSGNINCESCIMGKMTEQVFIGVKEPEAQRPLDLLYMDLCGPMANTSLGNNKYIFVIVDAYSKRIFVELLMNKTETYEKFMEFKRRRENEKNVKINRVRTDNGTEFVNKTFREMFSHEGIKHERTVIYSPSSNGVAERTNRTLLGTVRTLLIDSELPVSFWGEATVTAAYLKNSGYRKGLDGKTPMEKWNGRKPSVKHLKPFGCVAFGLIPRPIRKKLGPRARKGIMVGYSRDRKAYRLYMLDKKRVEEFRSVKFIEGDKGVKYMDIQKNEEHEIDQIRYNIDGYTKEIQDEVEEVQVNGYPDINNRREDIDREQLEEADEIEEQIEDENLEETDKIEEQIGIEELEESEVLELETEVPDPMENMGERRKGRPIGTRKGVVPERQQRIQEEHEVELRERGVRRSTRIENKRRDEEHVNQTTIEMERKKLPKNYKEAMESQERDKWKSAMEEELESMRNHNVWELVERKPKYKVLWNKWVFTKKMDEKGNLNRFKARLVVMGQHQERGIDFEESYSPVVKMETVRMIISLAAAFKQEVRTFDVKTAYLYGDLKEETYMVQPDGFSKNKSKVCKLKKSIYGLPQSGRMWNFKLNEVLKSIGAKRLNCDPCLYIFKEDKEIVIIGVYVDDMLVTGTNQYIINKVIKKLKEKFQLTEGPQNGSFLGIEIKKTDDGYEIGQEKQIDKLLEKYGMKECNAAKTPVDIDQKLEECNESSLVESKSYQEMIGSLSYVANGTRPDISFIVNKLAGYGRNPKEIHSNAAKRVLRYLKGTKDMKLRYKQRVEPLEGFADASWCSTEECRSQSGYCVKLCGNLITWKSRKQDLVALSSCEAEINATCEVLKEILWLVNVLNELELENLVKEPITIYTDSKAGLEWANGLYVRQRTKHFNRKAYKIREEVERNQIKLVHKPGDELEADLLTKGLPIFKMKKCMDSIGLC